MKHIAFITLALVTLSCAHPIHREMPCTECEDVSINIIKQNESNNRPHVTRKFLIVEAPDITMENKDRFACCIMRSMYQREEIRYHAMNIHIYRVSPEEGNWGYGDDYVAELVYAPNGEWSEADPDIPIDEYKFNVRWLGAFADNPPLTTDN